MGLELGLARRAARREREGERALALEAVAAAGEQAAHAPEAEPQGHGEAGHVGGLPEGEAVAAQEPHRHQRGADEAAVVGEAAGPEVGPGEAVGLVGVADAGLGVPVAAGVRRPGAREVEHPVHLAQAVGLLEVPVDAGRVGAEVHVVPEVAVREHVQQTAADHAHEQAGEAEIDDDVRILADASRPDGTDGGGEEEAREQQDEVRREADVEDAEQLRAHGLGPTSLSARARRERQPGGLGAEPPSRGPCRRREAGGRPRA